MTTATRRDGPGMASSRAPGIEAPPPSDAAVVDLYAPAGGVRPAAIPELVPRVVPGAEADAATREAAALVGAVRAIEPLILFQTVARHGSVEAAARALGVGTSPVALGLRALERDLCTRLFTRDRERLGLTAAGAQLGDVLGLHLGPIAARMAHLRQLGHTLFVGCPDPLLRAQLAALVPSLSHDIAGRPVRIVPEAQGDLVATLDPDIAAQTEAVLLFAEELVVVGAAGAFPMPLPDAVLAQETLLVSDDDADTDADRWRAILGREHLADLRPIADPEARHAALMAGAGLAMVAAPLVSDAVAEGRLRVLSDRRLWTDRAMHLCLSPHTFEPDHAREIAAALMAAYADPRADAGVDSGVDMGAESEDAPRLGATEPAFRMDAERVRDEAEAFPEGGPGSGSIAALPGPKDAWGSTALRTARGDPGSGPVPDPRAPDAAPQSAVAGRDVPMRGATDPGPNAVWGSTALRTARGDLGSGPVPDPEEPDAAPDPAVARRRDPKRGAGLPTTDTAWGAAALATARGVSGPGQVPDPRGSDAARDPAASARGASTRGAVAPRGIPVVDLDALFPDTGEDLLLGPDSAPPAVLTARAATM
ncbi:MAG: LysR family transcriptional regulator [Shimia sp.]